MPRSAAAPHSAVPVEIARARMVVWDFDGVIKESVDVKTRAFAALFEWAGPAVMAAVTAHHEANGGMSRMQKIPVYLQMAGEMPTPARVDEMCTRFGDLVMGAVIDAPWVPGIENFLRVNPYGQLFALVSATPEAELLHILDALALRDAFCAVHGAPMTKAHGLADVLARFALSASESVFVGDASADHAAALSCGVPFVLRRHSSNGKLFADFSGASFTEFPPCCPA